MWNQFHAWISNRDNVTFVIAIAGFALSVWNFMENILKNRKNLKITVRNVFLLGPDKDQRYSEILDISFENKSREAIVLSRLSIRCGNRQNSFAEYRVKLLELSHSTNRKETSRTIWYSDIFPHKIEGLGCAHFLLASVGDQSSMESGAPCFLTLYTNKGKIRMRFFCSFSNPELLPKCREPNIDIQELT